MLSVFEVAELFQVHHSTVRVLCKRGKIQFARIAGQLRFKREWIENYIHSRQARA
jgi:excisionase family DNA binding protein